MENQKPTLNPVLTEFWRTPARNRVLYGGRASSKSWDAAGFAIFLANQYKLRFLCTRQIQNKIEESVYTLLKTQIYRFGLQNNFEILKNKIINKVTKSEFVFYGLWRHVEEIKSLEGIDVCWIEEAHALTRQQWEILEPTIRKEHSQFWIIFNPQVVTDFVYKFFVLNTPRNTIVRKINYTENPFLSQTILNVINEMRETDHETYEHIYQGEPKTDDNDSFIKRSWINAAIDAHKKLGFDAEGIKTVGYDVADDGEDKNATAYRHGSILLSVKEWSAGEDEILKSCKKAYQVAKETGSEIIYDCIGVGASAGAKFKEINTENKGKIKYSKFNAGGAVAHPEKLYKDASTATEVKNKDHFMNVKAQAWQSLADRFKNTYNAIQNGAEFDPSNMIGLSSEHLTKEQIEKVKDELSAPHKQYDNNQKIKVESKKDMKKRGIPSPNIADAIVMSFANEFVKKSRSVFEVIG